MSRFVSVGLRLSGVCVAAVALAVAFPSSPGAVSSSIVISQVYGGGGNTGAPYNRDFVELFNRGNAPVPLSGMSVQYASASGTGSFSANPIAVLSGTLAPGQYYLVGMASGANGGPIPATDATSTANMSGTGGKVALVNSTSGLACNGSSTPCSSAQLAQITDLVGWGTANFFEGSPAGATTSSTAVIRGDLGCAETDNNATDFTVAAPAPRNSASAIHTCSGPPALSISDVSIAEGNSGTTTATFTVTLSGPSASAVSFDIATADDSATVADGDYVANGLTGQAIAAGQQAYTFDVTINGDANLETNEQFFVNVTNVTGAVLGDGQGIGTITNDDIAPPVYDVVISQVYGGGGNSGAFYRNDFIELFNHGATPVNLAGWSVQYGSPGGTTGNWSTHVLTSGTIQPGGYFLIQEGAGANTAAAVLPSPDATGSLALGGQSGKVLLRSNGTPVNGACAAGADIVDLVGYGNANCFEGAPAAQLSNTTAGIRKRGGCYDSNDNSADFSAGSPTPRNSATAARTCGYTTLAIHDIQGAGITTPYLGQDAMTTGIVTALKPNGFFLQAPDSAADADPLTSEGIFVFTGAVPALPVGAEALVKGTATEYFNLTQLDSSLPGDVTTTTTGNILPSPVTVTTPMLTAQQLERFEGMRMQTSALTTVAPTNEFGEVYTVLSGIPRPMREPGAPASLALPPDPLTGLPDCCVTRWDENPERLVIDTDGLLGASPLYVTSNVTMSGTTGPLDYTFGSFKLLPETPPSASANMSAIPVPAPAANEFTIASYNIENFAGGGTQLRKAALNIRTVMGSPDVIGVIEIASLSALESLAAQVNADAVAALEPNPAYAARLIPAPAGGTQQVGFLVKTSRVQIHDVWQYAGNDKLPSGAFLHDRPPLVLDATIDPNGVNPGRVLVVVNHPRSFIDVELDSAEGARVREKRTAQAESIAALLQDLQEDHPTTPVIAVGDYNAYQFSDGYTDPISIITGNPTPGDQIVYTGSPDLVTPDLVNLTNGLAPDQRYSFVFEGTPQALDHVLVNSVAQRYFQRYAVARSNADFPGAAAAGFSNDPTRPESNSDHDQPVAYFAFPGTPVVTLNGGATVNVEAFTSFTDPGASARDDFGPLPVTVTGSVNVNVPGTYTLAYTATNFYQTTTITRTVIVADTIAPSIAGFAVTPNALGPPNHKMVDVAVSFSVSDASGVAACTVAVASSEPVNGIGDGNTTPDWDVLDVHRLRLRAERSGAGVSRIYTVTLSCTDPSNNVSTAFGTVTVAK